MNFKKELEKLEKTVMDSAKTIRDYEERARAAEDQKTAALEDAITAERDADLTAYHKAKDAARLADDAAMLYSNKAKIIATEPLISPEEYEQRKTAAFAALDDEIRKYEDQALEHMRAIIAIADEASDLAKDGNAYLKTLQRDVFKEDSCLAEYKGHYEVCWLGLRMKDDALMRAKKAK